MAVPNIRTKRKVARALRGYARTMADWVRWSNKTSRMRPHTANAFLLGVMLDRSVPADRAWDAADWISSAIGARRQLLLPGGRSNCRRAAHRDPRLHAGGHQRTSRDAPERAQDPQRLRPVRHRERRRSTRGRHAVERAE